MTDTKCPFCKAKQTKSLKNWKFGLYQVQRYQCKCGKLFNYYNNGKSSFTIPKTKSE